MSKSDKAEVSFCGVMRRSVADAIGLAQMRWYGPLKTEINEAIGMASAKRLVGVVERTAGGIVVSTRPRDGESASVLFSVEILSLYTTALVTERGQPPVTVRTVDELYAAVAAVLGGVEMTRRLLDVAPR